MLRTAGFVDIVETDLTNDFRRTARGWYEGRERHAAEIVAAEGETAFTDRQNDSRSQLGALEAGLLRRCLFVARRP